MLLPSFSNVTCPLVHKEYTACILVYYPYGDTRDMMLLRETNTASVVLKGFLRDEPRIRVVAILADEDNPKSHSVSCMIYTLFRDT